jgi:hypothetical protein
MEFGALRYAACYQIFWAAFWDLRPNVYDGIKLTNERNQGGEEHADMNT